MRESEREKERQEVVSSVCFGEREYTSRFVVFLPTYFMYVFCKAHTESVKLCEREIESGTTTSAEKVSDGGLIAIYRNQTLIFPTLFFFTRLVR